MLMAPMLPCLAVCSGQLQGMGRMGEGSRRCLLLMRRYVRMCARACLLQRCCHRPSRILECCLMVRWWLDDARVCWWVVLIWPWSARTHARTHSRSHARRRCLPISILMHPHLMRWCGWQQLRVPGSRGVCGSPLQAGEACGVQSASTHTRTFDCHLECASTRQAAWGASRPAGTNCLMVVPHVRACTT